MLQPMHVLIVEDEFLIALDLASSVREAGSEVVGPTASVSEALELVEDETIDAAILDMDLMDGEVTEVAEALLERGIPVVIYTGKAQPTDLKARYPELTVCRKPMGSVSLVRRLAEMRQAA